MKTTFIFPRFKMLTGAEHLAIEFANSLSARGHDIKIITRDMENSCSLKIKGEIKIVKPLFWSRLSGFHFIDSMFDLLLSPFFLFLLPKEDDIFIFWNDNTISAMWLYKKLFRRNTPCVYYCLQPAHWAYDRIGQTILNNLPVSLLVPFFIIPYRFLDKVFVRAADKVFVLCAMMKETCRKIYSLENVEIAYAGVRINDMESGEVGKIKKMYAIKEPLILTVGKLIPKKNFDLFIRVIDRLKKKGRTVTGMIVGDGPCKKSLKKLVDDLKLGNDIIFAGYFKDDKDVYSAYNACDIYMYLEENVPFGLTILEAGIRNKPVIAAGGGGVNETIIDGKTGFIIKRLDDINEICGYIEELLDNPEKGIIMGQNARTHALKYDYDAIVDEFEQLLNKTVGKL